MTDIKEEKLTDEQPVVEEAPKDAAPRKLKKDEYIEGLGRRKRSIARVRIYNSTPAQSVKAKGFDVNGKKAEDFFIERYKEAVVAPLEKLNLADKFRMTVRVNGGGPTGQAEAVRMGLARALVDLEESYRGKLKRAGYLKRDPREKERKKPGLKKARRAPQFSKR